jgi:hypothetical protein
VFLAQLGNNTDLIGAAAMAIETGVKGNIRVKDVMDSVKTLASKTWMVLLLFLLPQRA